MKTPKHLSQHDITYLKGNLLARDTLSKCEDKTVGQRYVIWYEHLKQLASMVDLDDARGGFAEAMAERVVPPSTKIDVVGRGRNRFAKILRIKCHSLSYSGSCLNVIDFGTSKSISISLEPEDLLELAGRLITLGKHLSKAETL